MSEIKDDLDAVRIIVETLESFKNDERTRILRWVSEKLGMSIGASRSSVVTPASTLEFPRAGIDSRDSTSVRPDLKTFVADKQPNNDVHFATTVAYFYTFEAPDSERKTSIGSEDLQNACRLTGRERLQNPGQTLRNASFRGFLDKADERGQYRLNTVGENLVAVTLPGTSEVRGKNQRSSSKTKSGRKTKARKKKVSSSKK